MRTTATALRQDLYSLLDRAIETGESIEIIRNGVTVRIVPETKLTKLDALPKAAESSWLGDRDDIFRMDWLQDWKEEWRIED